MIHRVEFRDLEQSCVPWAKDIAWFKGKKSIEFKPGLNLIYGPNGTGKSTLLSIIARMLCCAQGGTQFVTEDAISLRAGNGFKGPLLGTVPIHDGRPVVHFDPGARVGLVGGSFDYDFMEEGLANTMRKVSSGQTTMSRSGTALGCLTGSVPWPEVRWKHNAYKEKDGLLAFLAGNCADEERTETPTVLLDEPTRSIDIDKDFQLWRGIAKFAKSKNVQVIAPTHSVVPLGMEGVHFIETQEGYVLTAKLRAISALEPLWRRIVKSEGQLKEVVDVEGQRDRDAANASGDKASSTDGAVPGVSVAAGRAREEPKRSVRSRKGTRAG